MGRIPEEFEVVLRVLHARMERVDFAWAITGSLGMALQGIEVDIHDVDLQTDAAGAYGLQARLAEFVSLPVTLRISERIRSHFGQLEIGGITVEIMGDVQKRATPEDAWAPLPDLKRVVRHVWHGSMRLPVLDLEYERRAYREMGRVEKERLIGKFLRARQGRRVRYPRPRPSRKGPLTRLRRPGRR